MPYPFPPDLQQRIEAQIASGQFATEDDVLREAMATLEKRQTGLEQLRRMVRQADEDIDAARIGPFDAGESKRAVRERLRERGITD